MNILTDTTDDLLIQFGKKCLKFYRRLSIIRAEYIRNTLSFVAPLFCKHFFFLETYLDGAFHDQKNKKISIRIDIVSRYQLRSLPILC